MDSFVIIFYIVCEHICYIVYEHMQAYSDTSMFFLRNIPQSRKKRLEYLDKINCEDIKIKYIPFWTFYSPALPNVHYLLQLVKHLQFLYRVEPFVMKDYYTFPELLEIFQNYTSFLDNCFVRQNPNTCSFKV